MLHFLTHPPQMQPYGNLYWDDALGLLGTAFIWGLLRTGEAFKTAYWFLVVAVTFSGVSSLLMLPLAYERNNWLVFAYQAFYVMLMIVVLLAVGLRLRRMWHVRLAKQQAKALFADHWQPQQERVMTVLDKDGRRIYP